MFVLEVCSSDLFQDADYGDMVTYNGDQGEILGHEEED